jgi:regulator of sigma D
LEKAKAKEEKALERERKALEKAKAKEEKVLERERKREEKAKDKALERERKALEKAKKKLEQRFKKLDWGQEVATALSKNYGDIEKSKEQDWDFKEDIA